MTFTGYEPKQLPLGQMERQGRASRRRPSREETADEKLDRLLEEERLKRAQARAQSERPAV